MPAIPKAFSKYSKSIFRDEAHLLVLAWLERSGETTEETLAEGLGKESDLIKRCLVDLHENGFVSYREETVRITESGKEVLDRLGLAEQIVESVLSMVHVPKKYRIALEHLLNQYRDSAYDYYLDTQASVSCYTAFHDTCHFSLARTESSKEFLSKANLAIVFRDLRNWMRHSTQGIFARREVLQSTGEHAQLRFLTESKWLGMKSDSSQVRDCLSLLAWCEHSTGKIEHSAEGLENSHHDMFSKVYFVFHDFQRRNRRESWLKNWLKASSHIEQAQRAPSISSFYKSMLRWTAQDSDSRDWSDWWDKLPPTYLMPIIVEGNSIALGHLLTARSLAEFCELTNLDKESATLLIRRISSKGHALLNED